MASNSTSTPKFKLLLPVRYFSQQTLFYLATVYWLKLHYNLGFAWKVLEIRGSWGFFTQKGQFSQLFPGLHEASLKRILLLFDSIVPISTAFLNWFPQQIGFRQGKCQRGEREVLLQVETPSLSSFWTKLGCEVSLHLWRHWWWSCGPAKMYC